MHLNINKKQTTYQFLNDRNPTFQTKNHAARNYFTVTFHRQYIKATGNLPKNLGAHPCIIMVIDPAYWQKWKVAPPGKWP